MKQQRGALAALKFKTEVLWAQLDALHHAYVTARYRPARSVRAPETMELESQSRPRLPKGVKLKHDEVRARWTLLAPERIFEIDATAAAVLELCDGERDLATIVAVLASAILRRRP